MKTIGSLILPLLMIGGCAHRADTRTASTVPAGGRSAVNAQGAGTGDGPAGGSGAGSCTSDGACGAGQVCVQSRCVTVAEHPEVCGGVSIHFQIDSVIVEDSERSALELAARCLKADAAMHVTVEGDADERGTDEYNMALGDRRAVQVAKYLKDLGASESQLRSVSYGKERPLCTEHDEACWARNRRAELQVANAGANTSPSRTRSKR